MFMHNELKSISCLVATVPHITYNSTKPVANDQMCLLSVSLPWVRLTPSRYASLMLSLPRMVVYGPPGTLVKVDLHLE